MFGVGCRVSRFNVSLKTNLNPNPQSPARNTEFSYAVHCLIPSVLSLPVAPVMKESTEDVSFGA